MASSVRRSASSQNWLEARRNASALACVEASISLLRALAMRTIS